MYRLFQILTNAVRPLYLILLLLLMSASSRADTPEHSLVIGWQFDDIITLDTAAIFEFSAAEIAGNTYDRLIGYNAQDVSKLYGVVAESWTISEDGKTFTFKIRQGITFASGNRLTAEDAAFSLQRAVLLNKSPVFILTQFGFTPENVKQKIKALDLETLSLEMDLAYAPSLVLYSLTATITSIIDKKEVLRHQVNGDLGATWLQTNYAGSGPFAIKRWKPSEIVVLTANPNYWGGAPAMKNIFIRHIEDSSIQQLLLERGDIDIARNLESDQLKSVGLNGNIKLQSKSKGALYYLSMNMSDPVLSIPQVQLAMKYLIDYEGLAKTVWAGRGEIHQAFLPSGFLGALSDQPFSLDIEKAKSLLAQVGLSQGFEVELLLRNVTVRVETAKSIKKTFAKAGIKIKLKAIDGKQALLQYRSRKHQLFLGTWEPDYQDPHTNADSFARNDDNSNTAIAKSVAWRNNFDSKAMTQQVQEAMLEFDTEKRIAMYVQLQKQHQLEAPFVFIMQEHERAGIRNDVFGFSLGPSFDSNSYKKVVKKLRL